MPDELQQTHWDIAEVGAACHPECAITQLATAAADCRRLSAELAKYRHDEAMDGNPIGFARELRALEAELSQVKAERHELRKKCMREDDDICQALGKALGYPWFKDDPKNFPNATAEDGVCVGDHVAASIAMEAAAALTAARERIARLEEEAEYRADLAGEG